MRFSKLGIPALPKNIPTLFSDIPCFVWESRDLFRDRVVHSTEKVFEHDLNGGSSDAFLLT